MMMRFSKLENRKFSKLTMYASEGREACFYHPVKFGNPESDTACSQNNSLFKGYK